MEKFGVEQAPEDVKEASADTKICPVCASPILPREETGVLLCARCGSKPFEVK